MSGMNEGSSLSRSRRSGSMRRGPRLRGREVECAALRQGDGPLTGSNEISLTFGEALAPDSDRLWSRRGRATAGARLWRVFADRDAERPPPVSCGSSGRVSLMARNCPGPLERPGSCVIRGGGQLVLVGVAQRPSFRPQETSEPSSGSASPSTPSPSSQSIGVARRVGDFVGGGCEQGARVDVGAVLEPLDQVGAGVLAPRPDLAPRLRLPLPSREPPSRGMERNSSVAMFGRNSFASIASPAMRATMPLFVMLSRHDSATCSIARAALRTASWSVVSTPPSISPHASASRP